MSPRELQTFHTSKSFHIDVYGEETEPKRGCFSACCSCFSRKKEKVRLTVVARTSARGQSSLVANVQRCLTQLPTM